MSKGGLQGCSVCGRLGVTGYEVTCVGTFRKYWLCDRCYEKFLMEVTRSDAWAEMEFVIRWMRYCVDGDRAKLMYWLRGRKS